MENQDQVFCKHCKEMVAYHVDKVDHWKQLLLTILSVGAWTPMWILMTVAPTKICDKCNDPIWK